MAVIEVNGITKDYGQGRGIFDLSFSIQKGEVFGFFRPKRRWKNNYFAAFNGVYSSRSRPDNDKREGLFFPSPLKSIKLLDIYQERSLFRRI